MNRRRLAVEERAEAMEEEAKKATAIRENKTRLRESRLAKEPEASRTKISTEKQAAKVKPKRRGRRRRSSLGLMRHDDP
jgi:hypothetical protein